MTAGGVEMGCIEAADGVDVWRLAEQGASRKKWRRGASLRRLTGRVGA